MGTLQQGKDDLEIPGFLKREQKPMANGTTAPASHDKGAVDAASKAGPAQTNGGSQPAPAANGTGDAPVKENKAEPAVKEAKPKMEPLRAPSAKNRSGTPSQQAAEDSKRAKEAAKGKKPEVKAKPAAPAKKPEVKAKPAPAKGKVEAKQPAKKADAKSKVEAKPTKGKVETKDKGKRESSVEKDHFGFKKGSLKSRAAAMYADPKGATLLEVKTKLDSSQLNVLVELEDRGYRVERKKEQGKGKRPITRYFLKGTPRKR